MLLLTIFNKTIKFINFSQKIFFLVSFYSYFEISFGKLQLKLIKIINHY